MIENKNIELQNIFEILKVFKQNVLSLFLKDLNIFGIENMLILKVKTSNIQQKGKKWDLSNFENKKFENKLSKKISN